MWSSVAREIREVSFSIKPPVDVSINPSERVNPKGRRTHWTSSRIIARSINIADWIRLWPAKEENPHRSFAQLADRFVLLHLKAQIISGTGRLFLSLRFWKFKWKNCWNYKMEKAISNHRTISFNLFSSCASEFYGFCSALGWMLA